MQAARIDELRILIVDAQAEDRALLREQLPDLPEVRFVFEEASSGEQAVEALQRSTFQCVLLDCALPGGSGVGWLKGLQQSAQMVPIIVLSRQSDEDLAVQSLKCGAFNANGVHFGSDSMPALPWTATSQLGGHSLAGIK